MTNLLHRNGEFVTFHRKCLKIHQPQCILQLVCEDYVLLVWVDLYVPLCMQQHTKSEWATHFVCPSFFFKLRSSPKHSNKNLTELDLQIQTSLSWKHSDTRSYELSSHSDRHCHHLPKYWLFVLNHSACPVIYANFPKWPLQVLTHPMNAFLFSPTCATYPALLIPLCCVVLKWISFENTLFLVNQNTIIVSSSVYVRLHVP